MEAKDEPAFDPNALTKEDASDDTQPDSQEQQDNDEHKEKQADQEKSADSKEKEPEKEKPKEEAMKKCVSCGELFNAAAIAGDVCPTCMFDRVDHRGQESKEAGSRAFGSAEDDGGADDDDLGGEHRDDDKEDTGKETGAEDEPEMEEKEEGKDGERLGLEVVGAAVKPSQDAKPESSRVEQKQTQDPSSASSSPPSAAASSVPAPSSSSPPVVPADSVLSKFAQDFHSQSPSGSPSNTSNINNTASAGLTSQNNNTSAASSSYLVPTPPSSSALPSFRDELKKSPENKGEEPPKRSSSPAVSVANDPEAIFDLLQVSLSVGVCMYVNVYFVNVYVSVYVNVC